MRRPPIALVLLAAVCVGACGSGKAARSGASPAPSPRPPAAGVGLTLRQQVGQVLVIAFAGTAPPEYVRRALREGRAAGVILFGSNVVSPAQVRALTASLQGGSGRGAESGGGTW